MLTNQLVNYSFSKKTAIICNEFTNSAKLCTNKLGKRSDYRELTVHLIVSNILNCL